MIVVAAGCGKTNEDAPAKPVEAPSKPAAPAPPPPPFTGKLTIERLMGADAAIGSPPPLAFAEAMVRAKGQLGEPTKVEGDTFGWAVVEGDDCAYVSLSKTDGKAFGIAGDAVGSVSGAMKVGTDGPIGNRNECLTMAGVVQGPAEDPDAAPPPADGSAVTVDVFRTTALAGRAKWKGQAVKVTGLVAGVNHTSSSEGGGWTVVTLKASNADAERPVACKLPKDSAATVTLHEPVVASGTVRIAEWMSRGGTTLEPELEACTVAPARPGKAKAAKAKGR